MSDKSFVENVKEFLRGGKAQKFDLSTRMKSTGNDYYRIANAKGKP